MMTTIVQMLGRGKVTVLAVVVALTLVGGSTALAGTGVGGNFNLGQINTVNALSRLVGSVAGPSLLIDNNSTNASATALDLRVEPGKAPMKVNSAARVANLNADKIDDRHANELNRVAFQKLNDSNLGSADGTAAATTINAPTRGFLVIEASSNVFNAQQNDPLVQCLFEVDNGADDPSRRFMQLNKDLNEEEDCSTNTVVPVDAGNHSVDLEARDVGSGTNFDQTTLSAVFVPFDKNGDIPAH